jgi:membrane-bound metal-dependent hydrolase YbcI (DUF457 family)
MFIGHFAVGFASKKFAPRTNLAVLLAAPLLLDILWPFFVLFGWEQVRIEPGNTAFTPFDFVNYPWSHSLLMSLVWASLFAAIYFWLTRYRMGAMVVWFGVVSHWILDWVSHRPDMPLYPGGPRVGLGLWNSIPGTLTVELLMFGGGLVLYVMATRARDRVGRYAFIAYVVLLLLAYFSDRLGGPPPSSINGDVIVPAMIAEAVLLPWSWWFDRHRVSLC